MHITASVFVNDDEAVSSRLRRWLEKLAPMSRRFLSAHVGEDERRRAHEAADNGA
jgi:thiamine phosphate synthase YjbQ (UPF0047 family)